MTDDFGVTRDAREDVFQLGLAPDVVDRLWQECARLAWPPRDLPGTEGIVVGLGCGWHRSNSGLLAEHVVVYRPARRHDARLLGRRVRVVVVRVLSNRQLVGAAPPGVLSRLADAADNPSSPDNPRRSGDPRISGDPGAGGSVGTSSGVVARLWQAILLARRRRQLP